MQFQRFHILQLSSKYRNSIHRNSSNQGKYVSTGGTLERARNSQSSQLDILPVNKGTYISSYRQQRK